MIEATGDTPLFAVDPPAAEPAAVTPVRVDAPTDIRLLGADDLASVHKSLDDLTAGFQRLSQVGQLRGLKIKQEALRKLADMNRTLNARAEEALAKPPVPAEELNGQEALRIVKLAEQRAREHNARFPPAKDETFVFADQDYVYTVYGDGRVTRSRQGELTPEQWEQTSKAVKERKSRLEDMDLQIAELGTQIASLESQIPPVTAEELASLPDPMRSLLSLQV